MDFLPHIRCMAWLIFLDESGQDHRESPYEVLAGVAVRDQDLWPLVTRLHELERRAFGRRYSAAERELKAKKILKRKVFDHAGLNCRVPPEDVPRLARETLDDGARNASLSHLKALALAKLDYVGSVLDACHEAGARIFASVIEKDAPRSTLDGLRKDYAYLFERFFYFLEDRETRNPSSEQGIVVFDELEKSQSHMLIGQVHAYFAGTATGRARSRLIIPEPFFVHSDLTTGIQLADIVAYLVSWGYRGMNMNKPARDELAPFVNRIRKMTYHAKRQRKGRPDFGIQSIAHIRDLRTQNERAGGRQ